MKKFWSQEDEERKLCLDWIKEPLINPQTGYPIERNGPTFNIWKNKCKKLGLKSLKNDDLSWRNYNEWKKQPDINPQTGRKIKVGGPTFKRLEKQAAKTPEKKIELLGNFYIPDKNGMVPTVIWRNKNYIVRKYQDRKVWGPLNKPAKNIKLVYYKDTWDYLYDHFKPVFIGGPPPQRLNNKVTIAPQQKKSPQLLIDKLIAAFI